MSYLTLASIEIDYVPEDSLDTYYKWRDALQRADEFWVTAKEVCEEGDDFYPYLLHMGNYLNEAEFWHVQLWQQMGKSYYRLMLQELYLQQTGKELEIERNEQRALNLLVTGQYSAAEYYATQEAKSFHALLLEEINEAIARATASLMFHR